MHALAILICLTNQMPSSMLATGERIPFLLEEGAVDPLAYWIGFNHVRGIGPARLRALLDSFGTVDAAWQAPADALREVGLDRRSLANLLQARAELDLADELAQGREAGVQVLTWEDPRYPERLKAINDPPPVLYVKGELRPEDDWAIAMVGTRHASAYGREVARLLATDLARAGVTIISGLARGIDASGASRGPGRGWPHDRRARLRCGHHLSVGEPASWPRRSSLKVL